MLPHQKRTIQMEYNNDNRTPLDRLTDDFLSELLDDNFDDHGENVFYPGNVRRAQKRNKNSREYYRPVNSEVQTENGGCDCHDSVSECGCGSCESFKSPHLHGVPLAMVYSPHQEWENIYDAEVGLERGTIFKCLDFPFMNAACDCASNVRSQGCSSR